MTADFIWRDACPACDKAARVRSHEFMAECVGCKARAAGRMPQFVEARKAGVITHGYRRLLQQFGLSHEQVKLAVAADKAAKA